MLRSNGAGKTTAVARISPPSVVPDAGPGPAWPAPMSWPKPRRYGVSIGVTAQDATLDELLTGRQNLVMVGAALAGCDVRTPRPA